MAEQRSLWRFYLKERELSGRPMPGAGSGNTVVTESAGGFEARGLAKKMESASAHCSLRDRDLGRPNTEGVNSSDSSP